MEQISENNLRFAIRRALAEASKPTLKAASTYGPPREDALDALTHRVMSKMTRWEILVPEPSPNFFADRPTPKGKPE